MCEENVENLSYKSIVYMSISMYIHLTRKRSVAKETYAFDVINAVIINYCCRLNQDFTKAHLSKYRLLSECCPTRGIFAYRGLDAYHTGKNTCAMTKTLAPECKWIYLRNVSAETSLTCSRQNATRISGDNKYVVFQYTRKCTLR